MQDPEPQQDSRARWLRDIMLKDNRDLLEREPELTPGKFAKMSVHPYNYFRGTAAIYYRDMLVPGTSNIPSKYTNAQNAHALIVGDPHPENYGTYLNKSDQMVIDINDFDSAMFGPFYLDVRRLGLGFYILGQMTIEQKTMTAEDRQVMINAVIKGYTDQLAALVKKDTGYTQNYARGDGKNQAGVIVGDLIRRAEKDGDVREALDDYTKVNKSDQRRIKFGVIEESDDKRIIRDTIASPDERYVQEIKNAHHPYTKTLMDSTQSGAPKSTASFKDIGRRLGAGVSSYPVQRFYVLVEGKTSNNKDDILLEYKEILDTPQLPGLTQFRQKRAMNNAQRVVNYQRQLQHSENNDPWLGWIALNPISFRVRERTKYQKGIKIDRIFEKLQDGDWSKKDLIEYARQTGQLLALAHARAKNINNKRGLEIIHMAIKSDIEGFHKETLNAINTYGPVILDDYQRFVDLLKIHGMNLGYRSIETSP